MIREFGRRYDGHPDLESVDMSFIGPWGEGAGDCSWDAIERLIDVYREAHPITPLVAMLKHKRSDGRRGEGWRVDGLGEVGMYRGPDIPDYVRWNHMYDWYPRILHERGARDVWLDESLPLPDWVQPGPIELSAGLLHSKTGQARVRFANKGLTDDGWLALGTIQVV